MASAHGTESSDVDSNNNTLPTSHDGRRGGERLPPTTTNGPQQQWNRRTGNDVSTDSLDRSTSKVVEHERNAIREVSPLQPHFGPPARGTSLSRKTSQDLSPTRNNINAFPHPVPSAAAVQRALSANKPPPQASGIDGTSETRNPKSTDSTPRWPNTPRLSSPPPSNPPRSSTHPTRKPDNDIATPNSSQKRMSASVPDLSMTAAQSVSEKDDNAALRSGLKTPVRGTGGVPPVLESVAENSVPATPSIVPPSDRSTVPSPHTCMDPQKDELPDAAASKTAKGGDSESDNGGANAKMDALATAGGKSSSSLAKKPSMNLALAKSKVAEPPTRSMTVETETVSSVPQAALNVAGDRGASGKLDVTGCVRLKTSNEMMKPKKEKKKNARRPTSINTGTISSKADIFEAKVASAVDEANSSDSDETFVYESNPPEPYVPRSARHHSRTPSATSIASQVDQHGARNKSNGKDGQHSIAGKRSMKFANYNVNLDGEYGSQGGGRGGVRTASTPRHHHISRHSRGPSHVGLFDCDSPFAPANKSLSPRAINGRSRPNSPRFTTARATSSPRKAEAYSYDVDGGVADDERMPLMGSVRVNRARHARRPNNGSLRQIDYVEDERRGFFTRHGACFLVTLLFVSLVVGAGSFITALSRPLVNVSIKEMKNVLPTEQELMLDISVQATNPNLFAITVSELNVDIFAKSAFARAGVEWRDPYSHIPARRTRWAQRQSGALGRGVDEGNDPIDDPGSDPQTMVLGRVFEFDSPLVFEASPIRRQPTMSWGEIRLTKPGNRTEDGGSARWERVIQRPFELIIGGAVRYQLPLSSRPRSASVRSRIMVHPKDREGARPFYDPEDASLLKP